MRNCHRFAFVAAVALLLSAASARATTFNFVDELTVNPPPPGTGIHGIARVGNEWLCANFNSGWNVYDLDFNQTGTVTTDIYTESPRGLVYNSISGNVYLGRIGENLIYEVSTTGTVLDSFPSTGGSGLNALAFDPIAEHLFAVHFDGEVVELTAGGAVVNSWTADTDTWTGAAFDARNNTLLMLTSSSDQVVEYTPDGELVDTPLPENAVGGNGQGLHYDSITGVLHVTSQGGNIAIWEREVDTAVQATSWGAIKHLY